MRQDILWKLAAILCTILFLSACSGIGSGQETRGTTLELDYSSFADGPEITEILIDSSGRISEGDDFYVDVFLKNYGSQDLSNGEITLSVAYSEGVIHWGTQTESNIHIVGYNRENPVPSEEWFEFDAFVQDIPSERSNLPLTLFATARFHYNTVLEQEVCINPSPYGPVQGNCEIPQGVVSTAPQYSPVVVRGFEQKVSNRLGRADFIFDIENQGNGAVSEIRVVHAELTAEEMHCEFYGEEGEAQGNTYVFGLGENSVELECEYNFDPNMAAIEKVLYLDLSYEYEIRESEEITVYADD